MQALGEMLQERDWERLWQDYMAMVTWSAARSQYKEYPLPSWLELTKKSAPADNRTAEEIRDALIARLNKDVNQE